ncbi:DcuS/MalK family sensor histidine kinase [Paenibacillus sp. CAA11]|uniref:DcuS/MalK family sensor histidine kinase n=1 Tax=Paenibacillus sp. CAA11 TaxID=1532905 RepID=UPI00131F0F0A|nr:DcuS/MalK family sensor histidine kinase [Paenibacillus sp. CAA11]
MRITKRTWGLQTTITLMVGAVLLIMLLALFAIFSYKIIPQTRQSMEDKALAIARTLATVPHISEGLQRGESREIQSYTSRITRRNDIMFVVILDMEGIRYSHPMKELIGRPFEGGGTDLVMQGKESVSPGQGPLGQSYRAFVPVFSSKGVQVGAVVVGLSRERMQHTIQQNSWLIAGILASGGLLGIAGAILLARKIKQLMFGLEPHEISMLLQERSAMLQSTREGIIAINQDAKVTLINREAERFLEIPSSFHSREPLKQPVTELWPELRLERALTNNVIWDEEIDLRGTTLLVNCMPIHSGQEVVGAIATFRDKTEIVRLAERLSGISLYAEALRAQAHEFMNKLHVIMGMTHMQRYEDLQQYLAGTVDRYQSELGSVARKIKDPVMAGFLLGKLSRSRETGIHLVVEDDSYVPECGDPELMHELITVIGNLLDNALDALLSTPAQPHKEIRLALIMEDGQLYGLVKDNGPGIAPDQQSSIFSQGFSTKGKDRGIGLYLAARSAAKLGGYVRLVPGELNQAAGETGAVFEFEVPYSLKSEGDG